MKQRPLVVLIWPRISDSPEQAQKMKQHIAEQRATEKDTLRQALFGMMWDRLDQEWNPRLNPDEIAARLEAEDRGDGV
jgi:hypothetical protein